MRKMLEYFKEMKDYRQSCKVKHKLVEIIVIIICAVVSGAENIAEIALYAKCKEEWLRTILELENGLPSQDTLERFMRYMDPEEFKRSFLHWVRSVAGVTNGEIVPIDGKTLRGSRDGGNKAITMVSAWARTNGVVLAQEKVSDKSNEIIAIPKLLKVLEIKGCIVTIDAMGCQKEITKKITEKNADYVLALKSNHEKLLEEVKNHLNETEEYQKITTENKGHGRIETREYFLETCIDWIPKKSEWTNFNAIGMVKSSVLEKGAIRQESRYFITSLTDIEKFADAVRGHWSIENNLHWVLDVVMCEDKARNRKDNSAENMAIIRHTALNLIKNDPSVKLSFKQMKKKLQWDHDYAMSLIFGQILP